MAGRKLTEKEQRAWARVVKSVKPMGDRAITFELPQDVDSEAQRDVPDTGRDLGEVPHPSRPRSYKVPKQNPAKRGAPADRGREKKIRRGQTSIAATLDLHGHTQVTAAAALESFLSGQRRQGARCVLIITGKGKLGEGILRRRFMDWITSKDAGALVSGYAQAHQRHGGSGAFYVFLRRVGNQFR